MTDADRTKLEAAGWKVIDTGFWRSPTTGHDMPAKAALSILAMRALQPGRTAARNRQFNRQSSRR